MNYFIIPAIKESNFKTLERVVEMICEDLATSPTELKAKNRERFYADRRHVAFYILNVYCNIDLLTIGKYFNRTHATVIHGRDKVEALGLINDFKIEEYKYKTIKFTTNGN
jgi:chromosomal replication initiation ATPase DnaA